MFPLCRDQHYPFRFHFIFVHFSLLKGKTIKYETNMKGKRNDVTTTLHCLFDGVSGGVLKKKLAILVFFGILVFCFGCAALA